MSQLWTDADGVTLLPSPTRFQDVNSSLQRFRRRIGAASLVVAPALMSVGDLMHPAESWDARAQVAIVAAAPGRWYMAHLLLLLGMMLLVPGVLVLTRTTAARRPAFGFASRVLILTSLAALTAVLAFEMVMGGFVGRAEPADAVTLLETFNSRVLVVLLPGLLAFFVGTGLFAAPLASTAGPLRWPALCFALGALLILGEIVSAQVILSQIGNVLILCAGIGFARVLWMEDRSSGPEVAVPA